MPHVPSKSIKNPRRNSLRFYSEHVYRFHRIAIGRVSGACQPKSIHILLTTKVHTSSLVWSATIESCLA